MQEIIEIELMLKERFKFYKDGNSLYKKTYDYLIKELTDEKYITQQQYKFLCWLNYNNSTQFTSTINKPNIPEVIESTVNEFAQMFCSNERRMELYNLMVALLHERKQDFGLNFIDVLIGGSFVDRNNETPNDIDCAILLNEKNIAIVAKNYENYCSHSKVDAQYLNEKCCLKDFWCYAVMTHLGNKAITKDENSMTLKNNTFEIRNVFKLRFTLGTTSFNAEQ